MKPTPERILIIRNDKLGDFTLSLPVFTQLRQHLPGAELHALVPAYTRPVAEACPAIDATVIDPGPGAGFRAQSLLARELRRNRYDAALTLFSTTRVGLLLLTVGIPYRLAPATKLSQLFYNHRHTQRRSRSEKPEYRYNLDLAERLLVDFGIAAPRRPEPPYLQFDSGELGRVGDQFAHEHGFPPDRRLIFLHPGSGGSAPNLSLEQYAALAKGLALGERYALVISAGPDEFDTARRLSDMIPDVRHRIYHSQAGLTRFAMHIALAHLFIGGSTGPLHIAGALDCRTAGFYTRRRSATSLRWQTLARDERRLAFEPPLSAGETEMAAIDVDAAAREINAKLLA